MAALQILLLVVLMLLALVFIRGWAMMKKAEVTSASRPVFQDTEILHTDFNEHTEFLERSH